MKKIIQYNYNEMRALISLAVIVIILGSIIFAYQWRNIKMSGVRYKISKLEKKKKILNLTLEKLRFSVADNSTTSRVEKLYRKKYGYVPLRLSRKIITLKLPTITKENNTK